MSEELSGGELISAEEPIIHLTENGIEGFEILCRLCANSSDHLISIYSEEGITNDLAQKMNLYLPVKVAKFDILPLQCCFQCASTVLAWHELVVASVEADRRLRDIQFEVEKQLAADELPGEAAEPSTSQTEQIEQNGQEEEEQEHEPNDTASLSPFRQDEVEVKLVVPSGITPPRKRGRKPKHQTSENKDGTIKIESSPSDTDGQWIKTELVMETDDTINPFIADCELTEDMDVKISPPVSDSDDLDPEYDPGNDTKTKTHHCTTCGKSFRKIVQLRRHEKLCTTDLKEELFKEEYLEGGLDDIDRDPLDEFQDAEIFGRKVKREYRCDYCPKMTVRREDLKDHVRTVHPEKFESFSLQRQRKRSKIDQEAVNRAKVVVDSRTYYHCNDCGKNLHSPYTYIWHIRIHTGERPYVCDLCGKQFRVSQGLVRHLRETHAGIKNFPCDLCGRMFATRRNVEEHRRIHTNERPYICDLCGKAFKQKASLFVHNRSHTDSFPFKCSYCNQGFRTRPPLLVHVTRHTGEKPYPCDICGRCFRIKYELKRHRLIHSDDKPFSCTDCGLSFRQKRYLRNHNKINHNRPTP